MSKSEDIASSSFGIIAAYQNTIVEMGPNHHGFYGLATINREEV